MPTSSLHVAPQLIHLVERTARHATILDVGPGFGKYATLLREYLNVKPRSIDAVEAWEPYVAAHRLERLYDDVYVGDAAANEWTCMAGGWRVDAAAMLGSYDVVLMIDVIEHMTKDAARRVVDRASGYVVICTPIEFFHNGDGLPPTEAHVSHWTEADWHELARGRRRVERADQDQGAWLVRLSPQHGSERPRENVHRAYT